MKKHDEILCAIAGKGSEFTLLALVEQLGELRSGDLHIIDVADEYREIEGEQHWAVYHKNGICFDIEKTAEYDDQGDFSGWHFDFSSEWDETGKFDAKKAIELVKKYAKT